jgi:hypothetical protein
VRFHDDQDADLCSSLLSLLQRWEESAARVCQARLHRCCAEPHWLLPAEIPILIAIAFWLSGGFIRSGLGARIAYSIVALFGKTTLVGHRIAGLDAS